MKRMPRLHDGTVTVDTDKSRLIEFHALSGHEPPDVGLTGIW